MEKKENLSQYLSEWKRGSDETEELMSDIHSISETGESISEPMRTKKKVVGWEEILIKGAQLAKLPLDSEEEVSTETVIGGGAEKPLKIQTPIMVTHMSFGALSREIKIALAKGAAAVGTAMGSGEGGILPEERDAAKKHIFEYVPNEYSVSDENLQKAAAVEIKMGQSVKPGMGGHLPAAKVTAEIAKIRGKKEGEDITSPAKFNDISNSEDLKKKIEWLREKSNGVPVGVKLAAGNVEDDLAVIVAAGADFVTIDGRPGATGSALKFVKDSASIPTLFALYRARKYLDENDAKDISLIITGGLRVSSDFAKALAMGADAVAIGTAALMACACQQYRVCNTGLCPMGVTTHNENLRKRIDIEKSAKKLENFLHVSTEELKDFARLTGSGDIHGLANKDLSTTSEEISNHTNIEHV